MSAPRSVLDLRAGLGESPVWDGREGALYWIDGRKPSINRFDPATARNHAVTLAEPVHAIALTRGHRLLCAFEASLSFIDCETGALQPLVSLIEGLEDNLKRRKSIDECGQTIHEQSLVVGYSNWNPHAGGVREK